MGRTLGAERTLGAVPRWVIGLLGVALAGQLSVATLRARPDARAEALPPAPSLATLRLAALGEPVAAGYAVSLQLQAYDNQPGISIPFAELDYARVIQWLRAIQALDPRSNYPLMMAAQVYSVVPDPARTRQMLAFVHEQFLLDPARRWRWLAHASLVARHRLNDNTLALRYARDITHLAPNAMSWARQMQIFILEDIGERDSAMILLGGLLAGGEIKDERELHFLTERLDSLKSGEKSAKSTKK